MTARCTTCAKRHRDTSKSSWTKAWLCMEFENDDIDPVTGEPDVPYKRCWDVLRVAAKNELSPCRFHEPERSAPEMVVREDFRGKNAKLKEVG